MKELDNDENLIRSEMLHELKLEKLNDKIKRDNIRKD